MSSVTHGPEVTVMKKIIKPVNIYSKLKKTKWQSLQMINLSIISDDSAALSALTKHFSVPLSRPVPASLWLLWAQAFVGVWPLQKKKLGIIEGEHRLVQHSYMCACVDCTSADTTQASAVSSHQLIPLPRSLLWYRGSQQLTVTRQVLHRLEGWGCTEAPVRLFASAVSSLWHNRNTHTHTRLPWGGKRSIDASPHIPQNNGTTSSTTRLKMLRRSGSTWIRLNKCTVTTVLLNQIKLKSHFKYCKSDKKILTLR